MGVSPSRRVFVLTTIEGYACQFQCGRALLSLSGEDVDSDPLRAHLTNPETISCLANLTSFVVQRKLMKLCRCFPRTCPSNFEVEVMDNRGQVVMKIVKLPKDKHNRLPVIPRFDFYDKFGAPLFRMSSLHDERLTPPQNQLVGYINEFEGIYQIKERRGRTILEAHSPSLDGFIMTAWNNAQIGVMVPDAKVRVTVTQLTALTIDIWQKACVIAIATDWLLTDEEQ